MDTEEIKRCLEKALEKLNGSENCFQGTYDIWIIENNVFSEIEDLINSALMELDE